MNREDREIQVTTRSFKLETAVCEVAELHVDSGDKPQQLKIDPMCVDERKTFADLTSRDEYFAVKKVTDLFEETAAESVQDWLDKDTQGTVARQTHSSSTHQPAKQLARQAAREKKTDEEEREKGEKGEVDMKREGKVVQREEEGKKQGRQGTEEKGRQRMRKKEREDEGDVVQGS